MSRLGEELENLIKRIVEDVGEKLVRDVVGDLDLDDLIEDTITEDTVSMAVESWLDSNFDVSDHISINSLVTEDNLIDLLLENLNPSHARRIIKLACKAD